MQTDALLQSFLSLESSIDANPAGALPTQTRNVKSARCPGNEGGANGARLPMVTDDVIYNSSFGRGWSLQ